MKVSMMFTILDAEGSVVTQKEKIVEINSEGLAMIEFWLKESEVDEWGTGLCNGYTLEVNPIECLENCEDYEELLAGGFAYTYDVSKGLRFGNETFYFAFPPPPWNPSRRSDAQESAVFTLS